MRQRNLLLAVTGILLSAGPALAQENVEQLKKQIQELQQRVEQLESQQRRPGSSATMFGGQEDWDPFSQMERMQQEMDRLFSNAFENRSGAPSGMFSTDMVFDQELDLKETNKGYEIRFDLAGLDKNQIDLQVNRNSITVSGKYEEEHQEERPNSFMQAQRFGTFMKTIPLPVDADTSKMTTEQKGDELVITLPKK